MIWWGKDQLWNVYITQDSLSHGADQAFQVSSAFKQALHNQALSVPIGMQQLVKSSSEHKVEGVIGRMNIYLYVNCSQKMPF